MYYSQSQPLYISFYEGKGRGVASSKPIKIGETIERAPMLDIDFYKNEDLQSYVFESPIGEERAAVGLGYASLFNHSDDDPSAMWEVKEENGHLTILIWAARDIAANEEININYGPEYWEAQNS